MRRAGWSIGVCSAVRARHGRAAARYAPSIDEAVRRRMVEGEVEAVRKVRGDRYARAYARANALALGIESRHPGRSAERRRSARSAARAWHRAGGSGAT